MMMTTWTTCSGARMLLCMLLLLQGASSVHSATLQRQNLGRAAAGIYNQLEHLQEAIAINPNNNNNNNNPQAALVVGDIVDDDGDDINNNNNNNNIVPEFPPAVSTNTLGEVPALKSLLQTEVQDQFRDLTGRMMLRALERRHREEQQQQQQQQQLMMMMMADNLNGVFDVDGGSRMMMMKKKNQKRGFDSISQSSGFGVQRGSFGSSNNGNDNLAFTFESLFPAIARGLRSSNK